MIAQSPEQAAQQLPERFRLNPPAIAERLGGDYTPDRIVEMIEDVERRQELAQEILANVPEASEQYEDIQALNERLNMVAETLPQKKEFYEGVKEKSNWAMDKIKGIVKHPVVATILIGLVAWWAWGHMHGILAAAHGEAAEVAAGAMATAGEGAGVVNPAMGEGLMEAGGAVGAPDPTILEELPLETPSAEPMLPPKPDIPPEIT